MVKKNKNGYRRRKTVVGIGTSIGATVSAAGVLTGQYDIPYEIGGALNGSQSAGAVLSKTVENVKQNWWMIALGIGAPMVAKRFLPNPTIYSGRRVVVKGI